MQAVQSGVRLATARLEQDAATAQSILALVADIARRGGFLSERLLAFTRRGELHPQQVDVAALLPQLGKMLARSSDTPLQIRIEAAPRLPPVQADPEELKAVLVGLATTARHAMAEGGTLTLGAGLAEVEAGMVHPARLRPGRYVLVSVADTGTGLCPDRLDDDPTLSTAGWTRPGVDLDLMMAHDFAERAGGGLSRESKAGIGTTVTLWLPSVKATSAEDSGSLTG
jgi:signal transduction histidine kinase